LARMGNIVHLTLSRNSDLLHPLLVKLFSRRSIATGPWLWVFEEC
jgi:hypothetical protein